MILIAVNIISLESVSMSSINWSMVATVGAGAAGQGATINNGMLLPPKVFVGDVMLFQPFSAHEVKIDDCDY